MEEKIKRLKGLVADKLLAYGFDENWVEVLSLMIRRVLSVRFWPDFPEFRLSRVPRRDRLNELEFYFPLKTISSLSLKSIFSRHCRKADLYSDFPERMGRLEFSPVKGFLKGYIDMVFQFQGRFYLVDWKSNLLGRSAEDYNQEAMVKAMARNHYFLQYHLYTLALDRYLRLRLPGYDYQKHFGGICYVFLRGVDPERGSHYGLFRDRPSVELTAELSNSLINEDGLLPATNPGTGDSPEV